MATKLPGLNPEEASDLLKADLEAIKKKVADGRPLSEADRRLIRQFAQPGNPVGAGDSSTPEDQSGKRWADSQVELAAVLGIARKTVERHLKKKDCPGKASNGKYDIFVWRFWLTQRGRKVGVKEEEDKNALECRKILQDLEIDEFKFKIEKSQYVSNTDVEQWFGTFAFGIKNTLLKWPGQVAPDVAKLFDLTPEQAETAALQINTFLAKKVTELLTGIADGPWQWQQHKEKAAASSPAS